MKDLDLSPIDADDDWFRAQSFGFVVIVLTALIGIGFLGLLIYWGGVMVLKLLR